MEGRNRGLTVVVELYLSTLTPSTVADFHGGACGHVTLSTCVRKPGENSRGILIGCE